MPDQPNIPTFSEDFSAFREDLSALRDLEEKARDPHFFADYLSSVVVYDPTAPIDSAGEGLSILEIADRKWINYKVVHDDYLTEAERRDNICEIFELKQESRRGENTSEQVADLAKALRSHEKTKEAFIVFTQSLCEVLRGQDAEKYNVAKNILKDLGIPVHPGESNYEGTFPTKPEP